MKPLLSILCIVMTLLTLVFLQMRERHISYAINKLHLKYKKKEEALNTYLMKLYSLQDPKYLQERAKKISLRPLQRKQIIYIEED